MSFEKKPTPSEFQECFKEKSQRETQSKNQIDDGDNSSLSESEIKLKHVRQKTKKKTGKPHSGRLTVSLRYGKFHQVNRVKKDFQKSIERKKSFKPSVKIPRPPEAPLKGKRGRLEGKLTEKPPQQESHDKWDSDEDSDNFYCYRVSLGYFQQFKDDSGASTSYQCEDDDCYKGSFRLENSEEQELLELERWGRTYLHEKVEELKVANEKKSEP